MKIIYKIYGDWKKSEVNILATHGINVELGYDSFDIEEGIIYQELLPFLNKLKAQIFYGTLYDEEEIDSSSLLVYNGSWTNGYPQPENDFGYIGITFNKENYCKICGTGLIQQSPFLLKKEPKWKTKKLFELNWIFDEIFVSKELYEQVFKKFGIQSMPVLLYKKETIIESTVQLIIPVTNDTLNIEKQPFETCNECGIIKYSPQIKGFFPSFKKSETITRIFKSQEYFGSGASAHKKIFINQALRQEMLKHKIKAQFMPLG